MNNSKKYMTLIIALVVIVITFIWNKEIGLKAVDTVKMSFKEIMNHLIR